MEVIMLKKFVLMVLLAALLSITALANETPAVYVTDFCWSDENGHFVYDAALLKDSLTADLTLKNPSSKAQNIKIILAVYYDGKLTDTAANTITLQGGENGTYKVGFDGVKKKLPQIPSDKLRIKCFVFEDTSLCPRSGGYELSNTNYSADIGNAAGDGQISIFVNGNAENGGNGTAGNPYRTVQEARQKIRTLKQKGQYPKKGVVVNIAGGSYYTRSGFYLGREDSGTKDGPVIYRAAENEEAVFTNGFEIDAGSAVSPKDEILQRLPTAARKNVKAIDLKALGITDYGELEVYGHGTAYFDNASIDYPKQNPISFYYGGQKLVPARYPNDGYIYTADIVSEGQITDGQFKKSVFGADATTAQRMENWETEDMWIYGFFNTDYSDISLPVESVDKGNKTITTAYPSPKPMKSNRKYYFYNVLEELDSPGEYYLDRKEGILYVYLPSGEGNTLRAALSNQAVMWMEGNKQQNVSNIRFENLRFEASRETCIVGNYVSGIEFNNCTVTNGNKGITFINAFNCSVTNSAVLNTDAGGISYYYTDKSIRNRIADTLTPVNNTVQNCEIYNFSMKRQTYAPAIQLAGTGIKVLNNEIHKSAHSAIIVSGNDHIIENNEIYDVLSLTADAGAIYGGYMKEERGTVIRNNYFHDCSTSATDATGIIAIYMDDLKDGCTVEGNLFVNWNGKGFYANGGRDNIVRNNIFINTEKAALFSKITALSEKPEDKYYIGKFSFEKYLDNPAYAKYPHFANLLADDWQYPKYNLYSGNIIINCHEDYDLADGKTNSVVTSEMMRAFNTVNASKVMLLDEAGFAGAENGNYRIEDNSPIYDYIPKENCPDFSNMGRKQ